MPPKDTTPPSLTVPAPIVVEATGPGGAGAAFRVLASDAVDGTEDATCVPGSSSLFPLGSTIVNCSAADASGNTATGQFTVTVLDTTAPVIAPIADVKLQAVDASGATLTLPAIAPATDVVDGTDAVVCTGPTDWKFPVGATTVSCTSTDAHGNIGTASFTVSVTYTLPALTVPANQTIEATSPGGAVATFAASATDATDGPLPVTCDPASGSMFPLGTTNVMCTARNALGVSNSQSFTVTVVDTTAPVFAPLATVTVEATSAAGAAIADAVLAAVGDRRGRPGDDHARAGRRISSRLARRPSSGWRRTRRVIQTQAQQQIVVRDTKAPS